MRSEYGVYANHVAKSETRSTKKMCLSCREKELLLDSLFLVDGNLINGLRKGYHRVCKTCFFEYLLKHKEVGIYSGNPEPWLERYLVLSVTPIVCEMGWISHDRKAVLKQFNIKKAKRKLTRCFKQAWWRSLRSLNVKEKNV